MPTYSYRCRDCDVAFDIQQSFSDDSLTVCPVCDGALRKKFNSVGVVFKGSGFYRTDSRGSTGDAGEGGSRKKDGGTSEKASTGGSDTAASSGSGSSGSAASSGSAPAGGASGSGTTAASGSSTSAA